MQYKTKYCDICGKNFSELDEHHEILGTGRKNADEDKLVIHICRLCHTELHKSAVSEKLSKMKGQQEWEFNYLINKFCSTDVDKALARTEAREMFRKRYQNSYLP